MLFWMGWGGFLGVAECWELLNKLLHFWRKDMNSNVNLKGEICLGSIVLAWDKDTGLCTQLCQGHCSILGSCKTFDACVSVFPPPWFRIVLGQSEFIRVHLTRDFSQAIKAALCIMSSSLNEREHNPSAPNSCSQSSHGFHLANARDGFHTMGW